MIPKTPFNIMRQGEKFVPQSFFLRGLLCWLALLAAAGLAHGQSNIVVNPSFEINWTEGWDHDANIGGTINERGAADGRNTVILGARIWQDLKTSAGRTYKITFAMGPGALQVSWASNFVARATNSSTLANNWLYQSYTVSATELTTRLVFDGAAGGAALDMVSVRWLEEPPSLLAPIASHSAYEGATVAFQAKVSGGPTLVYQWFRGDAAVTGATNAVLVITNAHVSDSGEFSLLATNAYGSLLTDSATLLVKQKPSVPLITSEPVSEFLAAGYAANLAVNAVGLQPLQYQWFFNGSPIPGATNTVLMFAATSVTNTGDYTVSVSNAFGSVLSLPAHLSIEAAQGNGQVELNNHSVPNGVDAPVYDVDGITKLGGANYLVQLWVGANSNSLHPVPPITSMRSGAGAGYFFPVATVMPDILPNAYVYVQVRVWDKTFGATYEQTRAGGGKFGHSDILFLQAGNYGSPPSLPAPLIGLWPFSLEAGVPLNASAKITLDRTIHDGLLHWVITGEPGGVYVVERRSPPQDWNPFLTITNVTGIATFTDPAGQSSSSAFYRAQILTQ